MAKTYIANAELICSGKRQLASVLIDGLFIEEVFPASAYSAYSPRNEDIVIDAEGKWLIPGVIDDQVHFRQPGLTYKEDIFSGSRAAIAGGITSFMEMPNTIPQTLSIELLEEKYLMGRDNSLANFSFYMGASNDNINEILKTDPSNVCGIKVFMGSSTGNMLVDSPEALNAIFSSAPILVAVHCEDEDSIQKNLALAKQKFGEDIPPEYHPLIRDEKACLISSSLAVELAREHGTRLHVLHLSTAEEINLFQSGKVEDKRITAEVCVHHLWFTDNDYQEKQNFIKWNPAIKSQKDRDALILALKDNKIDVVATDHAPHTLEEKSRKYQQSPSGGPLVQHALVAMIELYHQGKISLELIVEKMCNNPARLFNIDRRGFIKPAYYADMVLVDPDKKTMVTPENILYKCGWSPFTNYVFSSGVTHTLVNGNVVFENGRINDKHRGMRLIFNR